MLTNLKKNLNQAIVSVKIYNFISKKDAQIQQTPKFHM